MKPSKVLYSIEQKSKTEVILNLISDGEKDSLHFIQTGSGLLCIMGNTKRKYYSFSPIMGDEFSLSDGSVYIRRNSGALRGKDFILCEDGICIPHNCRNNSVSSIYQGYSEGTSSYVVGDMVFSLVYGKDDYGNTIIALKLKQ